MPLFQKVVQSLSTFDFKSPVILRGAPEKNCYGHDRFFSQKQSSPIIVSPLIPF